ncbi:MAG: hypothetical protein JXR03_13890 [Cyclobacteriaceae bacterium]
MGNELIPMYSLLFLLIIPLFFWYRVTYINRRKNSVRSKCPNCDYIQRLESVHNYSCSKCNQEIVYVDEKGERLQSNTYQCDTCGSTNLVGILACTQCGKKQDL